MVFRQIFPESIVAAHSSQKDLSCAPVGDAPVPRRHELGRARFNGGLGRQLHSAAASYNRQMAGAL